MVKKPRRTHRIKERERNMAAHQIFYWSAVPLKDKPYNTANWVLGTEHAYGFPTDRDAQTFKAEYKDASGVEEKDGRFYVMQVVP
jgi:hypothetical protein